MSNKSESLIDNNRGNADERVELLNIGRETEIDGRYRIVFYGDGPCTLGAGGSGIVFLAEHSITSNAKLKRAIKFFLYREDIANRQEVYTKVSRENFDQEIANIIQFNHQNILKVIDGGYYGTAGLYVPYIVTEYIPGETLLDLINEDDPDAFVAKVPNEEAFFDYLDQLLSGICYLHSLDFYHCDIAPKNVFMQLTGREMHLVLGDLGAGISLDEGSIEAYGDEKIHVIGSKDYSPKKVRDLIDKSISAEEFGQLQPNWDVYSTLKTINEFAEATITSFTRVGQSSSSIGALCDYIRTIDPVIASIQGIKNGISHIHPRQRTLADVPELSAADPRTRVRAIPVSSIIETERVRSIVKHPSFARLQDVPQLLMGSIIFPGANHTRYEHSLGSYEMMRKIMVGLLKKREFVSVLDIRTIELGLVGALLMSVTRFPFSYAIHELKNMDEGGRHYKSLSRRNLLKAALDDRPNGVKRSLWEVIEKGFGHIERSELEEVLCGSVDDYTNHNVQFVHSLLHSTIDVRVLDFLTRDAYHIGLENRPDFTGLVDHLAICDNHVAISSRGVNLAEQVVTQRYWMFKAVYWNEPNRLYTALLLYVFYELESEDFDKALANKFLTLTSHSMIGWLIKWSNEHGRSDIAALIEENFSRSRAKYKRLYVVNSAEARAVLDVFCERYSKMLYDERERIRVGLQELVLSEIGEGFDWDESRLGVLVDMPSDEEKKLGADITVISYDGHPVKLTQRSGIVLGMERNFDEQLRWLRVFVHEDIKEKIDGIGKDEGREGVKRSEQLEERLKTKIEDYLIGWAS